MPDPEIIRQLQSFRRRLLALDADTARQLIAVYQPIFTKFKAELQNMILTFQGEQLSFADAIRLTRTRALLVQVEQELKRYGDIASGRITLAQGRAIGFAQDDAQKLVDTALPRGMKLSTLVDIGVEWNALPTRTLEAFVGMAGDGSPLEKLLRPLGAEVSTGLRETIRVGIAQGLSPRTTADLIRRNFGMGLTRSLTISRTETLRAYREGSRSQYLVNRSIVKRWRRMATRDNRTCMACLALDGKEYDVQNPGDFHPNDRCAMEPVTIRYRDLGLDVPDSRPERGNLRDWFQEQSESTQKGMMGNARWQAWRDGAFALDDMAKVVPNRVWGPVAIEKPLKELVG